jgi:hypothetical protein
MNKIIGIVISIIFLSTMSFAESLQWQIPNFGLVNLNVDTTEALTGYDAVLKQALAGFDLPLYTCPGDYITLKIGADAPWQNGGGATVEPLILAGHNILGDIPALDAYSNLQLNVFGRWSSETGKAGAGVAFTYSFAGGSATTTP